MNAAGDIAPDEAGAAEAARADEEAVWWTQLRAGDSAARERLFTRHAEFARRIAARRYRERSYGDLDRRDLEQWAYAGLLEAIDRFDPARGVPFRGFAARRITGAVLDGLAKSSEVREQAAFQHRIRAERARSLASETTDTDSIEAALKALTDLAVGLALGFMLEAKGMVVAPGEVDERPNGYDSLAWKETTTRLAREVAALAPRERTILTQHYQHGVAFDQLALLLGVSKGRVSQLHRAALETLRARLAGETFSLTR